MTDGGLLSKAALHNNIGVLLRRRGGSDEEATSRFRSSILASSSPASCDECIEGLAWFHRKLSKELANAAPQPPAGPVVGSPSTPQTTKKGSDRRSLLARSKSKRESLVASVASSSHPCDDGRTPLGLEYFSEGITVGERATDGDVEAAARLNLASALYCANAAVDDDDEILTLVREASSLAVDLSLRAVAESNAGVILFKRGNASDASTCFREARDVLASDEFRITPRGGGVAVASTPPSEYLRIGCDLNAARAAVRLNDADLASSLVEEIASISASSSSAAAVPPALQRRMRWLVTESRHYISGLLSHRSSQWSAALCSYNEFISASRKTLGHNHPHVAMVLHLRGDVLFEQRNFHNAMISYLACLRILESPECEGSSDPREKARCLYCIGRTLHDREEFPDALRMYRRSLAIRKSLSGNGASVDVVTTLCNIGRVHHLMGDVDAALGANREVLELATALAGGNADHPFVVARRRAMGNMLVEAGRTSEAMEVFASVARSSGVSEGDEAWCDRDSSDVARRTAVLIAKAGLQHSCAPMA